MHVTEGLRNCLKISVT